MAEPAVVGDPDEYMKVAKTASELEDVVRVYRVYKTKSEQLREAEELLRNSDGMQFICSLIEQ